MFERFTDRARRVVVLAQDEARALNHGYIDTEHLLLGLVAEGEGMGVRALEALGITRDAVRRQVEQAAGRGDAPPPGHLPFRPRAKKVLELSLRESLQLGHDYIGTEHLLLGLMREREGVAAQALAALGADENRVRHQVSQMVPGQGGGGGGQGGVRVAGSRGQLGQVAGRLEEIIARLEAVEARLSGIERRLPPRQQPPGPGPAGGEGGQGTPAA
jgi:ATP-dependent Clp protease ATP-binding subunit ClpC